MYLATHIAKRLLIVSIALLLAACQSSNVLVDYDTEMNFSNFQYYNWLADRSGVADDIDPLLADRVKDALTQELFNAGFNVANQQHQADVLVRYYVATEIQNQEPRSGGSVGFGSSGSSSAMGLSLSFPLGDDGIVKETKIIIDLLSASDDKLKWRGSKTIKFSDQDPAEITSLITAAVAEIFSFYPPGAELK